MIELLKKYKTIIIGLISVCIALLFISQCNRTAEIRKKKNKIENQFRIAKKALKDSSVVIQAQSQDIALYDSLLATQKKRIDSLKQINTKTLTNTKIVYRDTSKDKVEGEIKDNTYEYSYDGKLLSFKSKTFFRKDPISFDSTLIFNKSLRLGISTFRYKEDDLIKVGAEPYYLKESGEFGQKVEKIDLKVRGLNDTSYSKLKRRKYVPTISLGIGGYFSRQGGPFLGAGIIIGYGRRLD